MVTLSINPPLSPPADAHWIGSEHPFDLHEVYLAFRSPRFHAPTGPATLWITGDSRYKLWVNGKYVARGPARSWPHHQAVDLVDLSPFLQPRDNVLAVELYQPGYSHFSYVHRGAAGLLAWGLADEDGRFRLTSDSSWRMQRDLSYAQDTPRISIYGSGVEERDLAACTPWRQPTFDDSSWSPARIVATADGPLWSGLHARTVAVPQEQEIQPAFVDVRRGPTGAGTTAHARLRSSWTTAASAQVSPDGDGWYDIRLSARESIFLLLDLGRNYTCQGWVEVGGAGGTEQLLVSYAEKVRNGELVLSDPETYCRVQLTDRFALAPGDQTAHGFSLRGGRYLLIQVTGPAGDGFRMRPHVTVSEYPLTVTKPLTLGDPILDGVVAMCETTARACLQETFVDCCWRESSQWLGDALPQALIMHALGDDLRPLRNVLVTAAAGAYPDGILPGILPGEVHAYTVLDYNFTWVELLALWSTLTEDEGEPLVQELWTTLEALLDRFHADRGEDGLIRSQPGRRLFLDWAPLARREPSALYNLRYLWALQTAIGLAKEREWAAEKMGDWGLRAAALAEAIRSAFQHDGRWYDDRERSTFSQHAASFAVLTGCASPDAVPALLDTVVARSLDLDDDVKPESMILASPFMHHYIFEALHQHGRSQDVIEIIRQRWGRWVAMGEPTTWENWAVDFPDGSICHAFSAHPRYHLARAVQTDKRIP